MDLLSVRHQHSIGDPERERARLSIMRLVHSQFSKAKRVQFYRRIFKDKRDNEA